MARQFWLQSTAKIQKISRIAVIRKMNLGFIWYFYWLIIIQPSTFFPTTNVSMVNVINVFSKISRI